MTQRLVWNFQFSTEHFISSTDLTNQDEEEVKWECRYFWPEDKIINLRIIDKSLLDLANYHQKHREDSYYLIPGYDYNIKIRRGELMYKPLLHKERHAFGFGPKINLNHKVKNQSTAPFPDFEKLTKKIQDKLKPVLVKKEAFIYKFATTPPIKLELARLEVDDRIYFSACLEGKSLYLVETLSKHLLGKAVSCDYVTFLKDILK